MTHNKKHEVKRWVEYSLYYQVEKMLPRGYEVSFSKSQISESTYLTISDQNDSLFTIRISDHFKPTHTSDEITILMSEEGRIKKMVSIRHEVRDLIFNRLQTY